MKFATKLQLSGTDAVSDARQTTSPIAHYEVVQISLDSQPPDLRRYYDAFVEALGTPVDIAEDYERGGQPTGDRWAEIRYDPKIPDDAAFRYSKNGQPLHTDESYVSSPAGIMLFYCVNSAPRGGETNFVSGRSLVDYLRSHEPRLLERLLGTKVRFMKAQDSKHRPIVQVDADGTVDLNYNYYCADRAQDPAALDLNQQFFDFLQTDLPQELVLPVALKPGEAVTWRDDRVLHGRNPFTAEKADDRLIWKTGIVLN